MEQPSRQPSRLRAAWQRAHVIKETTAAEHVLGYEKTVPPRPCGARSAPYPYGNGVVRLYRPRHGEAMYDPSFSAALASAGLAPGSSNTRTANGAGGNALRAVCQRAAQWPGPHTDER